MASSAIQLALGIAYLLLLGPELEREPDTLWQAKAWVGS